MDFLFSDEQRAIRDAIQKLCANFSADYWLECDNEGKYPQEFVNAIVESGWLGIAMPEAYGGAGLGITEATILVQAIAASGTSLVPPTVHIALMRRPTVEVRLSASLSATRRPKSPAPASMKPSVEAPV